MDVTSKSKSEEDGIRSLGEPISDSSDENNDDQRHQQIVGLEEEKVELNSIGNYSIKVFFSNSSSKIYFKKFYWHSSRISFPK